MSDIKFWLGEDGKESTVIPSISAVAVYTNPKGDIVIRQEDPMGDNDAVIVIARQHVPVLMKALKAEAAKKLTPEE